MSTRPPRRVTIRDVALEAGVGEATAARALGRYGRVSETSRQQVIAAARRLGYTPNAVARALASGSTQTIGLVVGDIENPFFATAARAMGDVLETAGFTLVLANSDERRDTERKVVASLLEQRIDGMAVAPAEQTGVEHLTALTRAGVPLVLMDRPVEDVEADTIMVDNVAASHTAVSHLLEEGYRRVALLVDSMEIVTSQERVEGARSAMATEGLRLPADQVVVAGQTADHARSAMLDLLNDPHPPDAVFAVSNFMTQGAIAALRESGARVPDDVALVSFDDPDWARLIDPPITAVAQPVRRLGELTAERLLERIHGDRSEPRIYRLPCEFTVRESSRRRSSR